MKRIMGDQALAETVDFLLGGVVPERRDEWEALKRRYNPQFVFLQHEPGEFLMGKVKRQNVVCFSQRTRDMIWILGFASWRVLHANADALFQRDPPYSAVACSALPEQDQVDAAVRDVMERLGSFFYDPPTTPCPWPARVPTPEDVVRRIDDPARTTLDERAVYNLNCTSMAFSLLHEIRHLMLEHDHEKPASCHEEEYACDRFAFDYLTAQLADYAVKHGYSSQAVLSKRGMGIVLALFVLLALSRTEQWSRMGRKHPPVAGRVKALVCDFDLPEKDNLWVFTVSLLVGLLRHQGQPMPSIAAPSPKALCFALIDWIGLEP